MNQKKECRIKFVKILEILESETDEQHFIKTNDLIEELKKVGVEISRKQLYKDMDTLIDEKYPIVKRGKKDENKEHDSPKKSNQNEYAIKHKFSGDELVILSNALVANNSLPYTTTSSLLGKIATLAPNTKENSNIDGVHLKELPKHSNEEVITSLKEINMAISQNKQIEFNYFKLSYDNIKQVRNSGKIYCVNPITTMFSNNHSYLIAYRQELDDISPFRLDRMEDMKISEDYSVNSDMIRKFDLADYTKKNFNMWGNKSELCNIYFEFKDNLIEAMKDKFGEKCGIECCKDQNGNAIYTLHQDVYVSDQFFGYIVGLGKGMKIREPQAVVDKFKSYIGKIRKKYD